jgi:hypothetical protein
MVASEEPSKPPSLAGPFVGTAISGARLRLFPSSCPTTLSFLPQGFLTEGLSRTIAGPGSVTSVDSKPLTAALLAVWGHQGGLFGETIGPLGALVLQESWDSAYLK